MHIEYVDPRTIDGDPHEVAQETGQQALVFIAQAMEAVEDFDWAARGAWQTAEFIRTGEMPSAQAWDASPQHQAINANHHSLRNAHSRQKTLTKSAAWNPKGALTDD